MNKMLKNIRNRIFLFFLLSIISVLFQIFFAMNLLPISIIIEIYLSGVIIGLLLGLYITALGKMKLSLFIDNTLSYFMIKFCFCWSVGVSVFFIIYWRFMIDYPLNLPFVFTSIALISFISFIVENIFRFFMKDNLNE